MATPTRTTSAPQHYETVSQAAKRTGLGTRTLRRYIAEGTLVAYRIGRSIRLRPEDVDALFTPTNAWAMGVK
ncbi:helix-turn-helix domain-containing protein [uncultured Corynebacterium sp.]|uniref:helix-turn-helix domain-containing protein n=1 Tax=uncultured Corynebacterium sp. TaxID=159447 RepID=UPI00288A9BD0|nr:helix-turn-helix domain-containing protein [uncultured Corynebacterium sp.]